MFQNQFFIIAFLVLSLVFRSASAQTVLQDFIKRGLDSNLNLRQKAFDLQQAKLDLQRAQSHFLPKVSLNSQYTLASGGRQQDLPIGDLLNGVYTTLNQLTSSTKFSPISNQTISFLPNDFHDTRFEITMPLVNSGIRYNRTVKEESIETRKAETDIYKRELVKNISQAYYQFLQASKAVEIYHNAQLLVAENLRVSEKLVAQGMATKEIVLRAKSQVSKVEAELAEAENQQKNASAYVNFLLNQPTDLTIKYDSSLLEKIPQSTDHYSSPLNNREELKQIKSIGRTIETKIRQDQSFIYPSINAFYNIGFQGFGLKFNNDQFYQLGGLQLQWNIFRGNDNKYRVRQSGLLLESINNQYDLAQQQIMLQTTTAYNNLNSAVRSLKAAAAEVESSRETYRLLERKFREGQTLQIELLDARTQYTNAEIRHSLSQLNVLLKSAEIERVNASYKF
ncbi:MAG: TolC family protein [Gemmatimonadaceae bacterium]|nr:TolC family protein [Chitinophagaceae bacterium]